MEKTLIAMKEAVFAENLLNLVKYLDNKKHIIKYNNLKQEITANALCASFRRKRKKEKIRKIRERNSEFAVFSRLLIESVQCYDKCMSEEKESVHSVYRGISSSFIISKFIARFNSPTSTSPKVMLNIICFYYFLNLIRFCCIWMYTVVISDEVCWRWNDIETNTTWKL